MAIFLMICALYTAIATALKIDRTGFYMLEKRYCSVPTSKGIEVGHLFSMKIARDVIIF